MASRGSKQRQCRAENGPIVRGSIQPGPGHMDRMKIAQVRGITSRRLRRSKLLGYRGEYLRRQRAERLRQAALTHTRPAKLVGADSALAKLAKRLPDMGGER